MAKRKSAPGPGAPEWMLTYGDMVTLLLCFFVLLFAYSTTDIVKIKAVQQSMNDAFSFSFSINNQSGSAQRVVPGGKGFVNMPNAANMMPIPKIVQRAKKLLGKVSIRDNLEIVAGKQDVRLRVPSGVMFERGFAVLKPQAKELLDALSPLLTEVPDNDIQIDGHTDDAPLSNPQFPSNWELSTARASAVARHFIEEHEINPKRFCVRGFASFQPLYPNDTDENRAKNRRVEIVLVTPLTPFKQDKPKSGLWENPNLRDPELDKPSPNW
ncbi:MAG TPA: flagellar motor protein MotB [Candidatus Ozemobacteraceae bacterium]|nr:flagellar motor protein MotB [Candidatus Ozemobacteraceae bacterium]